MREQRNDPKRLKDILQAIDTIFEYLLVTLRIAYFNIFEGQNNQ